MSSTEYSIHRYHKPTVIKSSQARSTIQLLGISDLLLALTLAPGSSTLDWDWNPTSLVLASEPLNLLG